MNGPSHHNPDGVAPDRTRRGPGRLAYGDGRSCEHDSHHGAIRLSCHYGVLMIAESAACAWADRPATMSAADAGSVIRSMASLAQIGSGGKSPLATAS